ALVADYARVRACIEAVLPIFADYEKRVREPGGFALKNTARDREWKTETGRARFMAHPVPRLAIPDGALRLMTIRSHDQFNTTVYGLDDRYRGVKGTRDVIFLHPADMEERGIKPGDRVRVKAKWPGDARERSLSGLRATPYDVPRG